jgi:hypothetical protein
VLEDVEDFFAVWKIFGIQLDDLREVEGNFIILESKRAQDMLLANLRDQLNRRINQGTQNT